MNHYLTVFLIIIGCGFFGGLINYFRLINDFKDSRFVFLKSLLTGLGASGLVPLFLKTISSDILESSKTNVSDYFVLGGLCLIAAIFSSKFIDSIGERLIKQIDEVSKNVDSVKLELDNITDEVELKPTKELNDEYKKLKPLALEILLKIYQSKYTYRSISGIASEIFRDKQTVKNQLEALETESLVAKALRSKNVFKWRLTEKGREIIAEHYGDESSH